MTGAIKAQLEALPSNLAGHLLVTVVALALGILMSIPLAITALHSPRLRYSILSTISIVQTVPGLALLALMIPTLVALNSLIGTSLGFEIPVLGFVPAVTALTLYSMLPMVRNSVTGILDVDPALVEAGRGVGMTRSQILRKIELPLALPIIIAGLRTATVWTVGTATLATPVGQRCLGNFIFRGLQTRNWTAVLIGCIAAALLAMLLDGLIAMIQRGVEKRQRALIIAASLALATLFAGGMLAPRLVSAALDEPAPRSGLSSDNSSNPTAFPAQKVVIGAKAFTEQYILQEAIALQLEQAGLPTQRLESLGSTVAFDALVGNEIDVYVDYSGTIWANQLRRSDSAPAQAVLNEVSNWLRKTHDITNLGALGFENAYTLAMRRSHADKLKIRTISDLTRYTSKLKIGGDYEFFGRREWRDLASAYQLKFASRLTLDPTFMYGAIARGEVDVISAFSSDGRIAALDLLVLDDDKQVIPPYDALILLSPKAAQRDDLVAALTKLVGAFTVEDMRTANYMVDRDRDKRSARDAAKWLLQHSMH